MTAVSYEIYDKFGTKIEIVKSWELAKTKAKAIGGTFKIIYTPVNAL